jgi:hypothetical protein
MDATPCGRGTGALFLILALTLPASAHGTAARDAECEFHPGAVRALHLAPGESARIQAGSLLETNLSQAVLEKYGWSVSPPRLGTASPVGGSIEWTPVENAENEGDLPRYRAGLVLDFTAGEQPGVELLALRIGLPEPDDLPLRCHGTEVLVSVTVTSDRELQTWGLNTEISSSGRMNAHGAIVGEFSLQPDDTVAGTARVRVTVQGTCVRGVSEGPMLIEGRRIDDMLEVVVFGDFRDDSEPDVTFVESMECVVITLRELPRLLTALTEWAAVGIGDARCPLEIPIAATNTTFDCGLLEYKIVKVN